MKNYLLKTRAIGSNADWTKIVRRSTSRRFADSIIDSIYGAFPVFCDTNAVAYVTSDNFEEIIVHKLSSRGAKESRIFLSTSNHQLAGREELAYFSLGLEQSYLARFITKIPGITEDIDSGGLALFEKFDSLGTLIYLNRLDSAVMLTASADFLECYVIQQVPGPKYEYPRRQQFKVVDPLSGKITKSYENQKYSIGFPLRLRKGDPLFYTVKTDDTLYFMKELESQKKAVFKVADAIEISTLFLSDTIPTLYYELRAEPGRTRAFECK